MRREFAMLGAVLALGCGPSPGSGDCRRLSAAAAVANARADAALPGHLLNEVLGGGLADDGRLEDGGDWTFYFHRAALGPDDFLAVQVLTGCAAQAWNPGGAGNTAPIPDYADAAAFVQVASAEARRLGVQWNLRLLQLRSVESPTDYPGVEHLAYVYFHQQVSGDPRDPRLIAYLDADDPRVLQTGQ